MSENGQDRTDLGTFAPHEVTQEKRDRVHELARTSTQEEIAALMGFSVETIHRHYSAEYARGDAEAKLEAKQKLLTKALEGSVNAIWKFLVMKRAISNQPIMIPGAPGPVDLTRLNPEQLEQYGRLSAIAEGLDPDALIFEVTGRA